MLKHVTPYAALALRGIAGTLPECEALCPLPRESESEVGGFVRRGTGETHAAEFLKILRNFFPELFP